MNDYYNKKCTVSVIIPTYGRPNYLQRAVNSVLNQTYAQIEIIVVDDNNPNSETRVLTESIMNKYENLPNVIYLKHEKNMNGAAARNTGIKKASGEYLCFLDDDDEMLPLRIEKFVKRMDALDDTWGACYSNFVKLKGNNRKDYCGEKRTGELYIEALMRSLYFCPGSNLFARTSMVKAIGGFDTEFKRNQDLEFLARLLEKCKLAYIDEITLIIHYENRDAKPMTYNDLVEIDNFYLSKFKGKIDKLSPKMKRKTYQYFALERLRYSIRKKNIADGINNCIENKVTLWLLIRYISYSFVRCIVRKSYGFQI